MAINSNGISVRLDMDWVIKRAEGVGMTVENSKGQSVTVYFSEDRGENHHLSCILLQLWQIYGIKVDGSYDYGFDYKGQD